jgi:peroxiredoxin
LISTNSLPNWIFRLKNTRRYKQLLFSRPETHGSVLLRQFAGKPLVISFYSSQWQNYGLNHLKQLNALQNEIKALGAQLLVITPDAADKALEELIWDNSLSLNFYFDAENTIAKKFKLYSDADPVWNKYPGIDVNVPLLATYIVDTTNQIIYDHVDYSLQSAIAAGDILNALHTSSLYIGDRKSA